jgi:hypothetical protein
MKITPQQWIEVVKLISTFLIGLITALCVRYYDVMSGTVSYRQYREIYQQDNTS